MENFKHYLELSNLFYLIKIDLNANYTYVNNHFVASFELEKDKIIGTDCLKSIIEDDRNICIETVKKCLASPKQSFTVKLIKPFKEGLYKHTEWEFTLNLDNHHNPKEIICIGYDISDNIKTDHKLTLSQVEIENINSKFEALFNTNSLGLVLHDSSGNIKVANQLFYEMIDYENYFNKSQNIFHFVPEKFWEEMKATLEVLKKTKESSFKELEIIHASGSIINVNINELIFEDSNGEFLVWSVIRDITERKNNLKLLENQKDLLKQTAEIAKLGGWEIHLNPFRREWTEEVYIIHDLDPKITHNLDNALGYYHPDDRPLLTEAQNLCKEKGTSYDLEIRLISAKKINKWVRLIGKAIYSDDIIQSIRGTVQDITEKKNIENIILKQQTLLKEIYFMQSHTIRLPLANILGLVDLLTFTIPNLDQENKEIFEKLKFSANQLDEVIRQVAEKEPEV